MKRLIPLFIFLFSILMIGYGYSGRVGYPSHSFPDTTKPKLYKVETSLDNWIRYANGLVILREQLKQSDLQSKNVSYLIDSIINPFQNEIASQIQKQLPKDTIKQK